MSGTQLEIVLVDGGGSSPEGGSPLPPSPGHPAGQRPPEDQPGAIDTNAHGPQVRQQPDSPELAPPPETDTSSKADSPPPHIEINTPQPRDSSIDFPQPSVEQLTRQITESFSEARIGPDTDRLDDLMSRMVDLLEAQTAPERTTGGNPDGNLDPYAKERDPAEGSRHDRSPTRDAPTQQQVRDLSGTIADLAKQIASRSDSISPTPGTTVTSGDAPGDVSYSSATSSIDQSSNASHTNVLANEARTVTSSETISPDHSTQTSYVGPIAQSSHTATTDSSATTTSTSTQTNSDQTTTSDQSTNGNTNSSNTTNQSPDSQPPVPTSRPGPLVDDSQPGPAAPESPDSQPPAPDSELAVQRRARRRSAHDTPRVVRRADIAIRRAQRRRAQRASDSRKQRRLTARSRSRTSRKASIAARRGTRVARGVAGEAATKLKDRGGQAIANVARKAPAPVRAGAGRLAARAAGTGVGRAVVGTAARVGISAGVGAATTTTTAGAAGAAGAAGVAGTAGAAGAAGTAGAAGAAGTGAVATGLAGAAAALGPLAIAVGAVVVALGGLGLALKKLSDISGKLSDELKDISPVIAGQRATAEVARFQSQRERAERIGPEVAQIEAAKSRLAEASYDVMTSIYEILLKFAPLFEIATDTLTAGLRGVDTIKQILDVMNPFGNFDKLKEMRDVVESSGAFSEAIADIFRTNEIDAREFDKQLMALLNQELPPPKPPPPNNPPLPPGGF